MQLKLILYDLLKIFHAKKGTTESNATDILTMLIVQYENEHQEPQ